MCILLDASSMFFERDVLWILYYRLCDFKLTVTLMCVLLDALVKLARILNSTARIWMLLNHKTITANLTSYMDCSLMLCLHILWLSKKKKKKKHHVLRFTFYNMSNFMFSERTYFDGTPTSKIWLCGTEKLKGQLQSFYPKCLELGWEFINKIPLIILFI